MAPPILLNKPVPMYRVRVYLQRSMIGDVAKELQEKGVMHIVEVSEKRSDIEEKLRRINDAMEKIEDILSFRRGKTVRVELTKLEILSADTDKLIDEVVRIYSEVERMRNTVRNLEAEIKKHRMIYKCLSMLPENLRLDALTYDGKYVSARTIMGRVDAVAGFMDKVSEKIVVLHVAYTENEQILYIAFPSRYAGEIDEYIRGYALLVIRKPRGIEADRVGEATKALAKKIEKLEEKYVEEKASLNNYINNVLVDLVKTRFILMNHAERYRAILNMIPTKYIAVLEGWVPANRITDVMELSKPAYIEYREPRRDETPPTLLQNPPIIKYFEPIVKFFGVPNYWEWDPTPIIAFSFALFFGLMLGDMGYSLLILLSAVFVLDKLAGDTESEDYKLFKKSIIVSSIIGFIVGFLSGSFLGDTLDYLSAMTGINLSYRLTTVFTDPVQFLVFSLIVGLIHVNISHIITAVKSYKNRAVGDLMAELGLFVAEIFGIPYVLYKMLGVQLPIITDANAYLYLYGALAGVALIIIGMIKSIGLLGLLMWMFSLTGLLGDVLSYARLAGVGLATIYLAMSFNQLASMVYTGAVGAIGGVAGIAIGVVSVILILFIGHLINTGLSALGSAIHAMRLCFVEFLSKFYGGDGYLFEPLRIVIRTRYLIE